MQKAHIVCVLACEAKRVSHTYTDIYTYTHLYRKAPILQFHEDYSWSADRDDNPFEDQADLNVFSIWGGCKRAAKPKKKSV